MRILIIEDEQKMSSYLHKGLTEASFNVDLANDGRHGLFLALRDDFDLIVLDVMLPEIDGFEVLTERERLGSTGLGAGIAIPHGKLPELRRLHGFFARLERPIDFAAVDDRPVDLIFALLAPENAGADHLKALARISRLLRSAAICGKLRGTDNADALYALLTDGSASAAA